MTNHFVVVTISGLLTVLFSVLITYSAGFAELSMEIFGACWCGIFYRPDTIPKAHIVQN